MHIDPVNQAPLWNVIHRGTGQIICQDEQGILLLDTGSNIYMIDHADPAIALEWIQQYLPFTEEPGLLSMNEAITQAVHAHYHVDTSGPCIQYVYTKEPFTDVRQNLLKLARPEDLPLIQAHYTLTGPEEILGAIKDERLFLIQDEQENTVGFVGEHSEGSMGFLEVFPAFRKQGLAYEVEKAMINWELSRQQVPYCHVFVPNEASHGLQKKSGMHRCDEQIEWMWIQPCSKSSEH